MTAEPVRDSCVAMTVYSEELSEQLRHDTRCHQLSRSNRGVSSAEANCMSGNVMLEAESNLIQKPR